MIKNTNDGTQNAPYLRCDINMGNLEALPDFSSAPSGDARAVLAGIKAAGFSGVQGCDAQLCREIGLRRTGSGRVNKLGEVDAIAANGAADGVDCVTLHVAWGIEDDAEVFALVEEILRASERHAIPLYIETHRATIAQDMWRTLQIVKRFPEVRFNGDFSHWYTGQEMVYGGFENKFDFIATVLERVRFIHGRIGNPGCIQVGIKNDGTETFIEHFKKLWTASFAGFLKSAAPGDFISFTPELLPPTIFYARTFPGPDGALIEESDRWQQALLYMQIAKACFAEALKKSCRPGGHR